MPFCGVINTGSNIPLNSQFYLTRNILLNVHQGRNVKPKRHVCNCLNVITSDSEISEPYCKNVTDSMYFLVVDP